jgi:hypothetical protein
MFKYVSYQPSPFPIPNHFLASNLQPRGAQTQRAVQAIPLNQMSGSPGDGGDLGDPDGGHLGKATFGAREVTWESHSLQSGVDIDIAIMLRDETRKVQKSMYELFAKQSDVLAELQKQISSIAQQVTAAWQKCMAVKKNWKKHISKAMLLFNGACMYCTNGVGSRESQQQRKPSPLCSVLEIQRN